MRCVDVPAEGSCQIRATGRELRRFKDFVGRGFVFCSIVRQLPLRRRYDCAVESQTRDARRRAVVQYPVCCTDDGPAGHRFAVMFMRRACLSDEDLELAERAFRSLAERWRGGPNRRRARNFWSTAVGDLRQPVAPAHAGQLSRNECGVRERVSPRGAFRRPGRVLPERVFGPWAPRARVSEA